MAVAVMPGIFVMITRIPRGDLFKSRRNVFEQSGLVFDGRDSCGRARNKNQRLTVRESVTPEQRGDLRGDVDDVRVAARRERNRISDEFHRYTFLTIKASSTCGSLRSVTWTGQRPAISSRRSFCSSVTSPVT